MAAWAPSPTQPSELRVQVELERSTNCGEAQWHTRHDESKYDSYEQKFVDCLTDVAAGKDYVYLCNPGPKAYGMHCRQSQYNSKLWHSMIKNERTLKWHQDVTFCYPRVGAFEVTVVKGKKRFPVYSKLKMQKWPHPQWLAGKVREVVEEKLGGWEPIDALEAGDSGLNATYGSDATSAPQSRTRRQVSATMSDEKLRAVIKKKFHTLLSAFKSFDKNGDGVISKKEFFEGLRSSGIELPKEQLAQLWAMADEDGTGNLQYQEFARKFSAYKASHSLHRHADFKKEGKQELLQKLHGVDAASRVAKRASLRGEEAALTWGVEGGVDVEEAVAASASTSTSSTSIQAIARDGAQMSIPVAQMNIDQIRAKIYKKHGSIVNAFRHFDLDGNGRIDFDEFCDYLPTALGEPIAATKMEEIWRACDVDLSGELEMKEFMSSEASFLDGRHRETLQGLQRFKDQAKDPAPRISVSSVMSAEVARNASSTAASSTGHSRSSSKETVAEPAANSASGASTITETITIPAATKKGSSPSESLSTNLDQTSSSVSLDTPLDSKEAGVNVNVMKPIVPPLVLA